MFKFLRNLIQKQTQEKENFTTEGAETYQSDIELSMKDEDLVKEIDADLRESRGLYDSILRISKENENYYLGNQLDRKYFSYELPQGENLLYANQETQLSIMTAKRREPIVLPAQRNDESRTLAEKTQQFLTWKWHEQDMSIKYEDCLRQACLSRIGVLKIRWDKDKDDFVIENIRTERIVIDKNAKTEYDAKFMAEYREDTLSDLIDLFPKAKKELTDQFGDKMATKINYVEYWTNELVVWKVGSIVLDKRKNPYWLWEESKKKGNKTLREIAKTNLKKQWTNQVRTEKLENILMNFFDFPTKPYVVFALKSLGKSIYGDTTDFEQSKIVQDRINKRERSIDKAITHALGREVYSGSYISKEESKKAISNPNSPMWIEKGNPNDATGYLSPQPISPVLMADLQDAKIALDNVFGTHSTTKGERGPTETATGRTILKEGDFGRIDLMVRRVDKKLELLYGWMLQMAKVYYTEQHWVKLLGSEGATTYLKFSADDIEDGVEVMVKSELTADKSTQRQTANERMQAKLIDPLTYFETLDEANPKEKARRLMFFMLDPKLYIQQFCVDAETPGVENDPLSKAKQENEKMMQGEQVPPFQNATQDHIEEHIKLGKSGELKGQDPTIVQNLAQHVQQEAEQLKQQKI